MGETTASDPDTTTPIVDANKDGIPDHLQKMVDTIPRLTPNWDNRRKVIHLSLAGFGGIYVLAGCALVACLITGGVLGRKAEIDNDLIEMLQTLMWTSMTAVVSIIGAYAFGANLDIANFRSTLTDMAGKIVTQKTRAG